MENCTAAAVQAVVVIHCGNDSDVLMHIDLFNAVMIVMY